MTHISPVTNEQVQTNLPSTSSKINLAITDVYGFSTLSRAGVSKRGFWSFCSRIGSCLCCFKNSKEIDWEETRSVFTGIEQAVLKPNDAKLDQKRFTQHYNELSTPARDLFNKHVGYGYAITEGHTDKEAKEKYVNTHWTEICSSISTSLEDITRTEVREAVMSFKREIEKHSKH